MEDSSWYGTSTGLYRWEHGARTMNPRNPTYTRFKSSGPWRLDSDWCLHGVYRAQDSVRFRHARVTSSLRLAHVSLCRQHATPAASFGYYDSGSSWNRTALCNSASQSNLVKEAPGRLSCLLRGYLGEKRLARLHPEQFDGQKWFQDDCNICEHQGHQ